MEIHSAPGPPRTQIVLDRGRRTATLEVRPGRERGAIRCADRTDYAVERPPGTAEWWIHDGQDRARAVVRRSRLLAERFLLHLEEPDDLDLEVVPCGGGLRRRWEVRDAEARTMLEVVQRRWSRPIHDLRPRSGDLPKDLPLVVAWTLALVTAPPQPATRRPRWTTA